MKINKIAFGWWEPFPMVNWIIDKVILQSEENPTGSSRQGEPVSDVAESNGSKSWLQSKEKNVPASSPYESAPRFITDQFLGTPSAGDYYDGSRHEFLTSSSSDFALTFNTTTIKLLFGECPAEKPSPEAKATPEERRREGSVTADESGAAYVKCLTDRALIFKTLETIIENLQGLTSKHSRSNGEYYSGSRPISAEEQSECSVLGAVTAEESGVSKAAIKIDCSYDAVRFVVKSLGMRESNGRDWDVYWTSRALPKTVYAKFKPHQRTNRFPESQELISKNNLAAYLTRMSGIFPREYDFFPKAWSLPKAWLELEAYSRTHPDEWFIVKPHKGCGGCGIYLTHDVPRLRGCRNMQAQVYIRKPLLIDGLKFDVRIYVLLTSCQPLRIFTYNEGLARFATVQYQEPTHQNRTNKYMHLTNYSLNKHSPTYVVNDTKGTLRRFSTVIEWMNKHNFHADKVSDCIDDVIIKTVVAMLPTLKYNYFSTFPDQLASSSAFQIFGFDIIFDRNMKPYVLEVNGQPSLKADVPLDIEMTNALVFDTFDILNLSCKSFLGVSTRKRIEWENAHLGNFRRIYPNDNTKHYGRFVAEAEKFILKNCRSRS